jgi:hypothetical protein
VTVIHGSNFVEGSTVLVDGAADPSGSNTLSSTRMEITPLSAGTHTLQVQSPNGSISNTVQVVVGTCTAAPTNLAPPTISGSTILGKTLTETNGSWTNNPPSFSYQWEDCDSSGMSCSPIAGATGQTHTLGSSDVGHTISVEEFDTTAAGTGGPATSSPTAVVTAPISAPAVSSSPPVVQGGTGAAFSGLVNPDGLPTTVFFEYGLDPKYSGGGPVVYDQSTPTQQVGSDFVSHAVSASVSGLVPNALYHARIVASNANGTTYGPDQTFTTGRAPAPSAPVLGQTANVIPVSGLVFIKPPAGKTLYAVRALAAGSVVKGQGFIPLTQARQVPIGSEIDARRGTLKLVVASTKKHHTMQARLTGSVFSLSQARSGLHKGLTTFALKERAFAGAPSYASCTARKASIARAGPDAQLAKLSPKVLQTLKASDHGGKFRTKGRYSAATVRGTDWWTAERCDGTLTIVKRGSVSVFDDRTRKTIIVKAGHSYLAKAP